MMQLSPEKQLIELIERGRIKKAKRLLKSNAPWPPCSLTEAFCAAAKRRNQRTISLLLEWGANINATDRHLQTPLYLVLKPGYQETSHLSLVRSIILGRRFFDAEPRR